MVLTKLKGARPLGTRMAHCLACRQAVGWSKKTGIRNEVAILNSRGQVWAWPEVAILGADQIKRSAASGDENGSLFRILFPPPPSNFALARSYPGERASKIQDGVRLPNGTETPVTACKQATHCHLPPIFTHVQLVLVILNCSIDKPTPPLPSPPFRGKLFFLCFA